MVGDCYQLFPSDLLVITESVHTPQKPPSSMVVYIYLIEPPKISYELIASVKTKADIYLINVFLYKFCISPGEKQNTHPTKVKMLKSQLRTEKQSVAVQRI